MPYKIVVDKQIRLFDPKENLTLETLTQFVLKSFPKIRSPSFHYIDQDGDKIILETKEDVLVYLEYDTKKPKIYVE